ncbi:kinase-like protein [Amniculicola lignicola CBS 123094]|uniref:Kinase-like protein n=1 Tax=Amniculicola lignicola CBS 123094 TaxID=1392246 RepID=A0A6A5WYK1_9PLEO|nr:kinase-like protein [Amniculicola lignicola CBS 123094]
MRSQASFVSARAFFPPQPLPGPRVSRQQNPHFIKEGQKSNDSNPMPVSEWMAHLRQKGILLDPMEALDWSGKGQHVEYEPSEENQIPLKVERTIGHSATALVESVMCRRIRLAQKRIRCNRRLTPYDAVVEVQHLQRLKHFHLIRVVGTYIIRRDLAILLYPVTEWNLEEFMDDTIDQLADVKDFSGSYEHRTRVLSLRTFFGCLCNSLQYIHRMNIKHMDIKPKNILVRKTDTPLSDRLDRFKVYIADFGIARSYSSAADAETDSPVSFTRAYAAPEVCLQEYRSFNADMFSLGCVFAEMLATILSTVPSNRRTELQRTRRNEYGETSFHANISAVRRWIGEVDKSDFFEDPRYVQTRKANLGLVEKIPYLLDPIPALRPNAEDMAACTEPLQCLKCNTGPEQFESATT